MKKILYVSANGFVGGAEKFILNVARMHSENKDPVTYLLFKDGELGNILREMKCDVYVLKNSFRFSNIKNLIMALFEIREFLRKNSFGVIHSTMGYTQAIMSFASLFLKSRRVWFQHGPIGGWVDYLASLFPVDVLLFSSHFLMEKHYGNIFLRGGAYGRKVVPLPIQLNESGIVESMSLKQELHLEGNFVFGMVGRISDGKGYEFAIKAFSKVDIDEARLLIIGSPNSAKDKQYYEKLKKQVEALSLKDKVLFLEHQTEIAKYYRIFDVYVNSSIHDEGFGLSVGEAMFLSVPVISSPYGGLSEFVKLGETAEVIYPREENAIVAIKDSMKKMYSDHIYAKKLSKNARELIVTKFNFSQTYVAITDVYQILSSIE